MKILNADLFSTVSEILFKKETSLISRISCKSFLVFLEKKLFGYYCSVCVIVYLYCSYCVCIFLSISGSISVLMLCLLRIHKVFMMSEHL